MMRQGSAENIALRLLSLCLCIACSVAYTGLVPVDPDNPKKCIYRGDTLMVGVTNVSAPCQRLTCYDDGSILIEGCGKLRIETCNRGERVNMNKPYPECCILKYKCKKPDGTPYYMERDVSQLEIKSKSENST